MYNKVHNIDCNVFMKDNPDKYYDLAIVDPPYGIDAGNKTNGNRKKYFQKSNFDKKENRYIFEQYLKLKRISRYQIIFGINYFDFALPGGRIIWDKENDGTDQSDCEIAYSSIDGLVHIIRYRWRGSNQGNIKRINNEIKIHPTQKPTNLYKILLQKYAKPSWKIFDSHVGSGSLRIACYDMGFEFEGCELDEYYFNAQEKRFQSHITNKELFETEEIQNLIYREVDLL